MITSFLEIKALDLPQLELAMLDVWAAEDTFSASISARADAPSFTFYEGPPTANGRPGIHHVLGRTIKDVFCRYKTLKGFRVERKGGWDTHGLPVEIEVEKELGLDGRAEIEKYGIEAFNAACRASVLRYKKDWDELTRRIGYWVDLETPYVTFHNEYIESVWWLLKQMVARDLLFKGYKIQWYSPGSGTVLSSHEVSLGYQEVTDPSVYVRFRDAVDPSLAYLVWTTTPWTLISNVALVVGEDLDYVTVQQGDERLVLATARLSALDGEYTVIEHHRGRDLLGRRYLPPFQVEGIDYPADSWRICGADYVTVDVGSGLVHIASALQTRRLCAQLSPRLAQGHSLDELSGGVLVHPHHRRERPPGGAEPDYQLAPAGDPRRPLWQLAGEQRRLGAVTQTLLGYAAADLGVGQARLRVFRSDRLDR